jgi:hypothetical protein
MNIAAFLNHRLFVASLLSIMFVSSFQTIVAREKTSLLISLATRSRPHQFFKNLDTFYQKLSHKIPYRFVINCDLDDETMNNPTVIKRLKGYPNLAFNFDANRSKVEACNRNIDQYDFDILLSVHDDMQALVKGFDEIIFNTMQEHFPDFDGVLNFNDGFVGGQCNTLPVIGRGFYDRFGYIYNPAYKALVCNVELTNVSKMLRKEVVIDEVIIRHNHPAWNAGRHDDLYTRSEAHHADDVAVFLQRRERNFDLTAEELTLATPKLWSILICTIEGREESFNRLTDKLMSQINALGLCDEIEILSCKDRRGEHTVGYKRNKLLETSSGYYTQFLDDDDDVHERFIPMLYEKLLKKPDCVSLTGIITFNGANPRKFVHSIQHNEYFERDSVYYRPPNHLNPIKRSIAIQFAFPEKNVGEDTDWAMAIARSDLIKTEEVIDIPYYFYLYNDKQ